MTKRTPQKRSERPAEGMDEQLEADYEEQYADLSKKLGFRVAVAISAIGLVVYAVALVHGSIVGIELTSCSQSVAQVGSQGVVEICRSLRPADFLPLAFLVGLLLLPYYVHVKLGPIEAKRMMRKRAEKSFKEEKQSEKREKKPDETDDSKQERRAKYFAAVEDLKEKEQAVMIMYYHSPYEATQADMAAAIDLSQGRVSQLLKSARQKVGEHVGDPVPTNRADWLKWMGYE